MKTVLRLLRPGVVTSPVVTTTPSWFQNIKKSEELLFSHCNVKYEQKSVPIGSSPLWNDETAELNTIVVEGTERQVFLNVVLLYFTNEKDTT